jgi:cold shock protein
MFFLCPHSLVTANHLADSGLDFRLSFGMISGVTTDFLTASVASARRIAARLSAIPPDNGGKDVFVHVSAVERAGLTGLQDNQKIGYELQTGRDGKESAGDLRPL